MATALKTLLPGWMVLHFNPGHEPGFAVKAVMSALLSNLRHSDVREDLA
jgi:hypothetical protein